MTAIENDRRAAEAILGRHVNIDPESTSDEDLRHTAGSTDRLGAVWAGKWRILVSAVVVGLLTLGITLILPKTYSSNVQVALNSSPVSGASVTDLATAANDLAAQYSQVVTTEVVLRPAAESSGTTSASLGERVTALTKANQNVVLITVQASTPDAAEREAAALGASLVTYVSETGASTSDRYRQQVEAQLAPLDEQIVSAKKAVNAITSTLSETSKETSSQVIAALTARLNAAQSLYSSLNDRRTALATQATVQAVSLAPQAVLLGDAAPAQQIEPRPGLYSAVAGLIGLVVAAQVVVLLAERRARLSTVTKR